MAAMTEVQEGPDPASAPEQQAAEDGMPEPQVAARRLVTEDWAATIVGLVLLGLALAGVITKGMIP